MAHGIDRLRKRVSRRAAVFGACALALAMALALSACALDLNVQTGSVPRSSSHGADTVPSADASAERVDTTGLESFDLASVPAFTDVFSVPLNGNVPYFDVGNAASASEETYSPLDDLGRCSTAVALVSEDIMPTESRGDISSVHPTGWRTDSYAWVDGNRLYNRCHLIAYQLSGENDNERNLVTGTRSMNTLGMLPYENRVARYVHETGNHVYYRVTPVFDGDNLVASGVIMEAESFEDNGSGVRFCVWCYNVEPGVVIDYATGDNHAAETGAPTGESGRAASSARSSSDAHEGEAHNGETYEASYVLNVKTMRFHMPECSSVHDMADANRKDVASTRDELVAQGYTPCGKCNP